jgi:uncharacterized protein (TIGR03435 family)
MKQIAFVSFLAIIPAFPQQPKFDLADIHASTAQTWPVQNSGGTLRDGLYINRAATKLHLIQAAYGVKEEDVVGGPSWLKSDVFDVIAKVPEGTTLATANLMLQALLADRFGLVIHRDTRPVPRYVLSIGKDGSKLKRAAESSDSGCRQQLGSAPGGRPASVPNIKLTCHNLTAQAIADNLQQMPGNYVDHPVLDSTKLEGTWDFELEYTQASILPEKGPDGITIFDALNKQLGLKLELQDVPMPVLVIESVKRMPTENPAGVTAGLALAAARFEVAIIKPVDPTQPHITGVGYRGGSQMQAGGTLLSLIAMALQLPPGVAGDIVVGLPKSADSQVWDITAKLPSTGEGSPNVVGGRTQAPSRSAVMEMLRGLLVDQFELKTHTENREVTAYALMQTGGKPKMVRANDSERSGCRIDYNAPKPSPKVSVMIVCTNTTMAEYARMLWNGTGYIDHPVVDVTGLEGGWDFQYGWSAARLTQSSQGPGPGPGAAAAQAVDPGEITVSDALQYQLGLKLVKQKRSIPVIVVDHVSETPIE